MRGAGSTGQSSLEYLVLIIAAVAACVGLRLYLQRSVEGRINDARWQVLGGAMPYYAEQRDPLIHFYNVNHSNQVVTAKVVSNTTTDFLGRTGKQYKTRFTTAVDFDECQGVTMSGNVKCK